MQRPLGQEKNGFEIDLALGVEMGVCDRVEVGLRDALVEINVLLFG